MDKDMKNLKKEELIKLASKKKLKVSSSMKKDEIIKALTKTAKETAAKKKAASVKPVAKKKAASKPAAKAKAPVKKETAKPVVKKKTVATKKASSVKKPATANAKSAPKATAKPAAKKKPSAILKKAASKPARAAVRPASPAVKKSAKPVAVERSAPEKAVEQKPRKSAVIRGTGARRDWDINLEGKKFFVADEGEEFPSAGSGEVPERYGDNRIVALVRDPRQIYVYWDTNSQAVTKALESIGASLDGAKWMLRVYDVTERGDDVDGASGFFDLEAAAFSGNRYIQIDQSGREFIVALGLMDRKLNFARLCVSNRVATPRASVSMSTDVDWMVPDEMFEKFYGLSGGGLAGASSMGASEMMLPIEEISSGAVSSFGASEEMIKEEKERGFFFWLNCELIVYGGTAPDATVTMLGRKIQLRPDGTFSARFSLPDGIHDIPVTAESADGVERREISPTVTRRTRVSVETAAGSEVE